MHLHIFTCNYLHIILYLKKQSLKLAHSCHIRVKCVLIGKSKKYSLSIKSSNANKGDHVNNKYNHLLYSPQSNINLNLSLNNKSVLYGLITNLFQMRIDFYQLTLNYIYKFELDFLLKIIICVTIVNHLTKIHLIMKNYALMHFLHAHLNANILKE